MDVLVVIVVAADLDFAHPGSGRKQQAWVGPAARSARSAGIGEVIVVAPPAALSAVEQQVPDGVTILVDEATLASQATAVRVAADYAARGGCDVLVAILGPRPSSAGSPGRPTGIEFSSELWEQLGLALKLPSAPIVVMRRGGHPIGVAIITAAAWPLVPLEGSLEPLWKSQLAQSLDLDYSPVVPSGFPASTDDLAAVTRLLGRAPAGPFRTVVREPSGDPIVIENSPFLDDGTPMPTRYWLVGAKERRAVGRLESTGGIEAAESAVDAETIASAHERYGKARDALIAPDRAGPRPSGGVGGTRVGVKCLHAHLANYLAGGFDPVGRWAAMRLSDELQGPCAAIDCGTNSTRLLVLGRDGKEIERRMTITRFGRDVDRTGELSSDAIAATVSAIAEYREVMDRHGVTALRIVATSAARDARNVSAFFDEVESVAGIRPVLIEGSEEGRLSYRGATGGLEDGDGPYLVVDLGGGSTELVGGQGGDHEPAVISLPVGCVRITERFFANDPPLASELDAARTYVASVVDEATAKLPELLAPRHMVGVAGTVAALVTLDLGDEHYDAARARHQVLKREAVLHWLSVLAAEPIAARRARRGVEESRADVIVAGALVLSVVMDVLHHDELVYSESDILDGVALSLLDAS